MNPIPGKLFFLFPMIAAVMNSCEVINPDEEIPAYIQVDTLVVHTDVPTQGSSSSNFSDVWVTVDGQFLSGYPLGRKVPVLFNGPHTVTLRAGIELNGIEATRVPYAVFGGFDTLVDLKPGMVHHITPRVTYYSSTHFPLIEDFDHSSFQFSAPITSAPLQLDTASFENNGGLVIMNAANTTFECTTIDSFDLPGGTTPTYIEINYKCNTEFLVGVKANTTLGPLDFPLLNVRSADTWKKIYVNLTSIAMQAQHATDWKVYLKATLPSSETSDTLRFDNIKLVY